MFNNPMVAYDGSEPSTRALRAGIELASRLQVPLRLITVVEGLPPYVTAEAYGGADAQVIQDLNSQQDEFTQDLLKAAEQLASAAGVQLLAEAQAGDEVESIVNAVHRHHCDLLIVGLRHHPGLIDRMLSRTTHALAERAPCSVLGVR